MLFVLDVESVLKDKKLEGTLRITRENPIHWTSGQQEKDRYFETAAEFAKAFTFGDFGKHFTFRTKDGILSLSDHIDHLLLDDPGDALGDSSIFKVSKAALEAAAKRGGLKINVQKRGCRGACKCLDDYKADAKAQKAMFAS